MSLNNFTIFPDSNILSLDFNLWLKETVIVMRKGALTPIHSTQQNYFVEMSRVVAVRMVTPKDATQLNCLVESGLSVWPRSRSDWSRPVSTSFADSEHFQFWPVELSRIVSTVTPNGATRYRLAYIRDPVLPSPTPPTPPNRPNTWVGLLKTAIELNWILLSKNASVDTKVDQ